MSNNGGSIELKAKFNVAELNAQLESGADAVVASTRAMEGGFVHLESVSSALAKKISADTREMAQVIDISNAKAAIAYQKHTAALAELRAAQTLVRRTNGENAQELAILAAAQERAAITARALAVAEEEAGVGAAALANGAHEATAGMALMGEEGFVKINRHMRGFIADLPLVGSLMSKAFSVFAIIGLVQILGEAYTKIVETAEVLGGYTEEVKKFDAEMVKENEKILLSFKSVQQGQKVIADLNHELAEQPNKWAKLTEASKEFNTVSSIGLTALLGPLYKVYQGYQIIKDLFASTKEAEIKATNERIKALEHLSELNIKNEENTVQRSLEAFKSGSSARVKILQDEISKLGDSPVWHDYVERLKGELVTAEREMQQETQRTRQEAGRKGIEQERSNVRDLIAITREGSMERLQLLQLEDAKLRGMGSNYAGLEKEVDRQIITARRQLTEAIDKENENQQRDWSRHLHLELQEYMDSNDEKIKEGKKQIALNEEFIDEELRHGEQMDLLDLQNKKLKFEAEAVLGRKNSAAMLADEKKFVDQDVAIRTAWLREKLRLLQLDPTSNPNTMKKIEHQITEIVRQGENEKERITKKSVDHRRQLELSIANSMKASMTNMVMGWLDGTQTITQSMAQMGKAILADIVDVLAEMLTQWITTHILMKVFGIASQKSTSQGEIMSAGAVTYANTFASISAIPIVGPAMAPGAAAAASTLMLTTATAMNIPSAAQGMVTPSDGLAFLHRKEMVLPEHLSSGIEGLIANGNGGGINISPTIHASAMDTRGLLPVLKKFEKRIVRNAKAAIKNGRFNLSPA